MTSALWFKKQRQQVKLIVSSDTGPQKKKKEKKASIPIPRPPTRPHNKHKNSVISIQCQLSGRFPVASTELFQSTQVFTEVGNSGEKRFGRSESLTFEPTSTTAGIWRS